MNNLLYIYLVDLQSKGLLVNLVMSEQAFSTFRLAVQEFNNSNYRSALYLLNSLRASDLDNDLKQQIAELELQVAVKLKEIKDN